VKRERAAGTRASRRLRLPNAIASVAAASEWARALAAQTGLHDDDVFRLDLCLTELLTNAVSYGGHDPSASPLELSLEVTPGAVRFTMIDAGVEFDPLGGVLPALPESFAEGARGGFGVRLLREFADQADYMRRDGRNVLRFVLHRTGAGEAQPPVWRDRGEDRRSPQRTATFPLVDDTGRTISAERRSTLDRRLLGFISSVRLFRGAPYSMVEPVIAECQRRSIRAGEIWLAPGERSNEIAIVLSGQLSVHVERPDSPPNFLIESGHCAGEMQLLDGKPASAYVIAACDSELLMIPAELLHERLIPIPKVANNLLQILAGRIRRSDRLIAEQVRAAMELERLQRELKLAQEIQVSMLPVPPLFADLPQIDCVGCMRAAKAVGGDFYDAFALDAQHVFITIGDICGKGLPSALFMVRTLTTLWNETSRRRNPQRIVELVNRQLCANNDSSLFVSLFCGVYNLDTRQLVFANAGHDPPLIAVAGEPFRPLQGPHGPVAGLMPDAVYRTGTTQLVPGSTLLLFTDGVTEAESAQPEWFGEARLREALEANRRAPLPELAERVVAAVDAFAGDAVQADDITLLAFRVNR
jgi:phosphoserine phosphatase RsbU/P